MSNQSPSSTANSGSAANTDPAGIYPRKVILVHGIKTKGPWIEETEKLLFPFFTSVKLRYTHYLRFGATKLVGEPWAIGAAAIAATTAGLVAGPLALVAVSALGFAGVRASARGRLERALENYVKEFAAEASDRGRRPSVIAHSLGTALTGSALQRFPGIRLCRVVFCGCVLPRDYPWVQYVRGAKRVAAVRNEVGLRDPVPRLARAGSFFAAGFGSAGSEGFMGPADLVHNVPQPGTSVAAQVCEAECPYCSIAVKAPVHNVPLEFAHSTGFVGGSQCVNFWLPFLLGYDPGEYQCLLDLCVDAEETQRLYPDRLRLVELELGERRWGWVEGSLQARLMQRIHVEYPSLVPQDRRLVLLAQKAIGRFWTRIAHALAERDSKGDRDPQILYDLDPRVAFERSVRDVVGQ